MSEGKPIGLLGGAFDPVHSVHIQIARACLDILDLQEVRFIPAHIPPHKVVASAGPQPRLAMLELALRPYPQLTSSAIEIDRGGMSYTIDTLLSLRAAAPQQSFCFILGADAFATLPSWRRWRELTDHAHLVIIDRGAARPTTWREPLREYYDARACPDAARLHERRAGCIHRAALTVPDISSSQARALLHEAGPAERLLPPGVHAYIKERQLYT